MLLVPMGVAPNAKLCPVSLKIRTNQLPVPSRILCVMLSPEKVTAPRLRAGGRFCVLCYI